jgi:hypothetical protein
MDPLTKELIKTALSDDTENRTINECGFLLKLDMKILPSSSVEEFI